MKMMRTFTMLLIAALLITALPARSQPQDQALLEKTTQVVKKMRDEKISVSKAWEDKILTKDVLLYALGTDGVLDSQPGQWRGAPESFAWSQLLVEQFSELLAKPGDLPLGAQVKVARWLLSKRDPRIVEMLENVLKDVSREKPDFPAASMAISLLADYYSENGESEKSIATSLRAQEFTKEPEILATHLFSAARVAAGSGDTARAKQFYEQVIGASKSWMYAQAVIGLSQLLEKEGKQDEARALLQKPVEGEDAEETRFQLDNQLMQSYFQRGEWDETRKWAKTITDRYNALKTPNKEQRWQWMVQNAQRMPEQIEQWQKNPVQLYTEQISVSVAPDETEPVRTYFNANSYRSFTVKAVADNPAVTVWPLQSSQEYDASSYQMVGVEIAPGAFPKDVGGETKAEITVAFEEFPGTTFRIPIKIQRVEKQVQENE